MKKNIFSPTKIVLGVFITAGIIGLLKGIIPFESTKSQGLKEPSSVFPIVAITKIVSHPSLDAIEQGILDELKDQKLDLDIRLENAQGNLATATQIAQKFLSESPQLIIPITTPSAQTVYNAVKDSQIAVVFAAISDPVGAKLVDAKTMKGEGITGVSDVSPIQMQLDLIKKFQPSLKKIGFLYNPGEANSVSMLKHFEEISEKMGFTVIEAACPNSSEVPNVTRPLLETVEAIYIPNDNTIISALESVLRVVGTKLPIYAADPDSVKRGCLAAVALSQYQIGREVGKVSARVLKGENPSDIPVVIPTQVETAVNRDVAEKLGIDIPADLMPFIIN